ncbi:MAG: hypothetical protein JW716_02255 [Candidatus Aenigmarchaeota archaeon]|nr:hypothetical protein [Candidatus Aenigmarchaeota archaeon]
MSNIVLVGWDFDKVAHDSYTTSILAEYNKADPAEHVSYLKQRGIFTDTDVSRWQQDFGGREIKTISDLAAFMTAGLYEMKKPGSDDPLISKENVKAGKQYILRGATIDDAKRASEGIRYINGFEAATEAFRKAGLSQSLFSDGMGPMIDHQRIKHRMTAGGGVPPILDIGGVKTTYSVIHLNSPTAVLTGETEKYNKIQNFFNYLIRAKTPLSQVAVIDDSGENVEHLLKPVMEAGGIAIGFNPTKAHTGQFVKAGIPILVQEEKSLEPFIDIVQDRRTIGRHCV